MIDEYRGNDSDDTKKNSKISPLKQSVSKKSKRSTILRTPRVLKVQAMRSSGETGESNSPVPVPRISRSSSRVNKMISSH